MKRLKRIISIFAIIILISCSQDRFSNSEIIQEIINVTKEYNEAWETVDMNSVAQFHAKDIRYHRQLLFIALRLATTSPVATRVMLTLRIRSDAHSRTPPYPLLKLRIAQLILHNCI